MSWPNWPAMLVCAQSFRFVESSLSSLGAKKHVCTYLFLDAHAHPCNWTSPSNGASNAYHRNKVKRHRSRKKSSTKSLWNAGIWHKGDIIQRSLKWGQSTDRHTAIQRKRGTPAKFTSTLAQTCLCAESVCPPAQSCLRQQTETYIFTCIFFHLWRRVLIIWCHICKWYCAQRRSAHAQRIHMNVCTMFAHWQICLCLWVRSKVTDVKTQCLAKPCVRSCQVAFF